MLILDLNHLQEILQNLSYMGPFVGLILCGLGLPLPEEAFLLMAGKPHPGPHETVRMTDERAAANRQIHRASLVSAGDLPPGGGDADLNSPRVLADAELVAHDLHARCDFLMRVSEPSQLGKFGYEPAKVVGTCRASGSDMGPSAYAKLSNTCASSAASPAA